jgi:O-antigen ligase
VVVGEAVAVWMFAVTAGPASLRAPLIAGAAVALVLALAPNARRLLLAVVLLDVPLQVGRFFAYQDGPANLGAIGGVELSLTTVAIICLWAMRLVEAPRPDASSRWRAAKPVALPLVLYVAVVAISAAFAGDVALSFFEIVMLVQTLAVFLYIATSLADRAEVLFAVDWILVGLVLQGALAVWLRLGGAAIDVAGIESRVDEGAFERFGGTIGAPNTAAAYFGMLLIVALAVLLAPVAPRRRALAGAALVLGGVGLVTTFGRGGWLAAAVSLVVFLGIARRQKLLAAGVRIRPAAVAIILVFVLVFGGLVGSRVVEDDSNAAGSRVPLLDTAGAMIADHPLSGVGANNYAEAAAPYLTRDVAHNWFYTVHDKYLLVWSEGGLAALIAFVWFLVATVRTGLRASRDGDRTMRLIVLALVAGIVGHMFHMLVEILNGRGPVQALWTMAALVVAIAAVNAVSTTASRDRRARAAATGDGRAGP